MLLKPTYVICTLNPVVTVCIILAMSFFKPDANTDYY